jgi:hypothetical protein
MKYFDYLFYRFSDYYIKRWKDDTGTMYGIGIVTIMLLIHLVFIKLIIAFAFPNANEFLFERQEGKNFIESGAIYTAIIVFGLVLLRYLKFQKIEKLELKWKDENALTRKKKAWGIALYIFLNLSITIGLSIYRRYYF